MPSDCDDLTGEPIRGAVRATVWVLWTVRGVRLRHIRSLEQRCGGALAKMSEWEADQLKRTLREAGLVESMVERVCDRFATLESPVAELECARAATEEEGGLVHLRDPDYPRRLLELDDPPVFLCVDGDIEACRRKHSLSVVGSRDATVADVRAAKCIVREIASAGVVVVSGGAIGIDRAAHEAALDVGGETVALLPSGLDRPTPTSNRDLFGRVSRSGALVTEYPQGVEVRSYHFPRRNRLIAALGDATFVVRAGPESGTMLTAEAASELGRPISALPGPLDAPLAQGCLQLIRDGAQLVRNADDLLETHFPSIVEASSGRADGEVSGAEAANDTDCTAGEVPKLPESLSEDARSAASLLGADASATHVDQLGDELGWTAGRLQSALLELELHGLCEKVGGAQSYRLRRG